MLKQIQSLLRGFLTIFVCIALGGCFKSAPKPNPQIEDTIISIAESEEIVDINNDLNNEEATFIKGNYAGNEVAAKIFFEFDNYRLSERDRSTLNSVAEQLKAEPGKSVYIFGHTDWWGSDEYNERLSMRRNQAIADYLKLVGIKAERINCIALGNHYATPNLSKTDALKDRRCDVVIH